MSPVSQFFNGLSRQDEGSIIVYGKIFSVTDR